MDISKIDENFRIVNSTAEGVCFYDADSAHFRVHGLLREDGTYCRLPSAVAQATNEGVARLAWNTAGGRVRFVTDSPEIHIRAAMFDIGKIPHMALTGSAGFDLYVDEGGGQQYRGTFIPPYDMTEGYSSMLHLPDARRRVVTIHFPLYSSVKRLLIGMPEGAVLEKAPAYGVEKPVVYYGSSITQGGCASRPGNAYEAIVSRWLDCDHINLGFSGSARGEDSTTAYIAGLDMAALVMDYDHNAPSCAHLEATHQRMFQTVREKQPTLPILLMSRPVYRLTAEEQERLAIIRRTYEVAKAGGDDHVYLLEGPAMIGASMADVCSVDGSHPNDSGFVMMARAVAAVLKDVL